MTNELNRLEATLERLAQDHPVRVAFDGVKAAKATGTAKAWFARHDGAQVSTVQLSANNPATGQFSVWAPLGRHVKAGATFVKLEGSRRDYAGLRVLHANDNALVVHDSSTGADILYVRDNAPECAMPGAHSADLIQVHTGNSEPVYRCGKHQQQADFEADRRNREFQASLVSRGLVPPAQVDSIF